MDKKNLIDRHIQEKKKSTFEYSKSILEYNIPIVFLEKIHSYLIPLTLNKGEKFIEKGKKNDKIAILNSGLILSLYTSENGKEGVSRIYSKINGNIIVSNHESFHYDIPSTEDLIAIEETHILVLRKKDLKKLLLKNPELEKIISDISEKSFISIVERLKEFQSFTAKERIEIHYHRYAELFTKIKKQYLASYLGINRNDFTKHLNEIINK